MYKYLIPNYQEEVFGDNIPRSADVIQEKLFGYSGTDSIGHWVREKKTTRKKADKFIYTIQVSDLRNYTDWKGGKPIAKKFIPYIEDIKQNGIETPLLVVEDPVEKGAFHIIEGHHRAGSAKLLGIKTVQAFVLRRIY